MVGDDSLFMQIKVDACETADGHLPFLMDDDGCIIYDSNGQPTVNQNLIIQNPVLHMLMSCGMEQVGNLVPMSIRI